MMKDVKPEWEKYQKMLIKADLKLVKMFPYFSNFYMGMETKMTTRDISYTNGDSITVSIPFLDEFPKSGAIFVKFHETEHCYLGHLNRYKMIGGDSDGRHLYNLLADYIIWTHGQESAFSLMDQHELNNMATKVVSQQTIQKMMRQCLQGTWEADYKKAGLTLEQVDQTYRFLRPYVIPGIGKNECDMGDSDGPGGYTSEIHKRVEGRVIDSWASSKSMGKGGGGIIEELNRIWCKPEILWRRVIRKTIESQIRGPYSFAKYNKRSKYVGAILPAQTRKKSVKLMVAVDVSGSVGTKQLKKFFGEIKGLVMKNEVNMLLITFDDGIHNRFIVKTPSDFDKIKSIDGRGGTSFKEPIELAKKEKYANLIIMTDLYGDQDECRKPAGMNLWWICSTKNIAPLHLGQTYPLNNDVED